MIALMPPKPFDVRRTFRWLQSDRLCHDFMMSAKPTPERHFEYWRGIMSGNSSDMHFSIVHDGAHIGNCGIKNIADSVAEIWLYIGLNTDRGSGFGSAAMLELIRFSRAINIKYLCLHVREENIPAIALYKKFFFTELMSSGARSMGFDTDGVVYKMGLQL